MPASSTPRAPSPNSSSSRSIPASARPSSTPPAAPAVSSTCAIEHLRKQAKTEADERGIQDCFAGIEKKHLPHVLCMTNLLLHGIEVPSNVRHDNTLARPLRDWRPKERVDVIVTNPPFGGMEEDGIEANFPAEFRTRETADLFLVLLMKILKPGGRAGLVLPDGTLFGEGVKTRIKEALLTDCNLHTIVRLPNGVFNPYTGIRTNLLFFTKGRPTTEVWYYEHPYPPGAKSYNKGKPIRIEEFEASAPGGARKRTASPPAWKTSGPGASPSTRSRPATSTSTSRTRTTRTPGRGTWITSCPNTKSSSPRSPRLGTLSRPSSWRH